jgi:cyclin H
MLRAELPERFTEYWGKVRCQVPRIIDLTSLANETRVKHDSNVIIKPLIKKLKKCRDPDRWDLVALQQAKKEGAVKAAGKKNGLTDEDGAVFGSDGLALDAREAKRRKVNAAMADPFGPPLKG